MKAAGWRCRVTSPALMPRYDELVRQPNSTAGIPRRVLCGGHRWSLPSWGPPCRASRALLKRFRLATVARAEGAKMYRLEFSMIAGPSGLSCVLLSPNAGLRENYDAQNDFAPRFHSADVVGMQ